MLAVLAGLAAVWLLANLAILAWLLLEARRMDRKP